MRNWLLFFAVPVLFGILPSPFLSHLALLVTGVYLFSTQKILQHQFDLADSFMRQFYTEFTALYGKEYKMPTAHFTPTITIVRQCTSGWSLAS